MSHWTSPVNFSLVAVVCLHVFVSVVPSMATPLPLPLALMMTDYSPSLVSGNHSFATLVSPWRDVHLGSSLPPHHRRITGSDDNLLTSFNAAKSNANELKRLAAQSSSVDSNDPDFQSNFVTALTNFNNNMDDFNTALADSTSRGSGSDKGLANYDRTNVLESLLKEVVNANKDTLSATVVTVDKIPILGPVLGPLVYDLKCLIDKILDIVENCTDSAINQLQPLLAAILGQAISDACRSGVELLGLCI